jgi:hypothetical protein
MKIKKTSFEILRNPCPFYLKIKYKYISVLLEKDLDIESLGPGLMVGEFYS